MNLVLNLNGIMQRVTITSVERALDVLIRQCDVKSLPGTCLEGQCGGCLVLIDNKPAYSCLMPAFTLRDRRVETIEYFTKTREYNFLYSELSKEGTALCSSCHNGIMLMGMALLRRTLTPARDEILNTLANVHCDSISPDDFADAVLKTIQHLAIARKTP
jgi:carbon-monoxide dehydrogenase small subunit